MVFEATFNYITAISWRSVLLVQETGVPEENHPPAAINEKRYRRMLYWIHLAWAGFELTTLVMIGTDGIGSYNV